ncbi:MAG: single-stranded-DNA-specific exonuclease RecJ [Dehalococcoidia bacterium]|nr:single-stranded-DNA-specific exonuclease RecJ [Dehalococcoidia bacterium]
MLDKVWNLLPAPPDGFADSIGHPPFEAQLLYNRGIHRAGEAAAFLNAGDDLAHDPFLLPDMDKAAARLRTAVLWNDTVGVFGDFDTDGVSGTAIVVSALESLGLKVVPYLPHRVDEGHGLNIQAVETLAEQGVTLLVTVDNGISSRSEIAHAAKHGIETIITDHHALPDDPPDATAIVNPRRGDSVYPYEHLTGAGLAYKVIEGLWMSLGRERPERLLELAALGTVADVAPMSGENRYIVKRGLELLKETDHPGLRALFMVSGANRGELDSEALSFSVIPRLNAAGRLGDAKISLDLLTTSDKQKAGTIASQLESVNEQRKALAATSIEEARRQVYSSPGGRLPPLLFVESEDWLPGILGLIASNLSEQFCRPAVVVRRGEKESRASARSIPEFDIIDAIRSTSPNLLRHGGHPEAAGFTVATDDLSRLQGELVASAEERLQDTMLVPSLEIDAVASPTSLPGDRFEFIRRIGPHGKGNPAPTLLMRDAGVLRAIKVGGGREHLKLQLGHGGKVWDAIAFKQAEKQVRHGDTLDVVYTFGLNSWNGQTTFQLTVLDFRPSAGH